MRAIFRILAITLLLGLAAEPSAAQSSPQPANSTYAPGEILDAGNHFFGGVSRGLAQIIERAVSQWGLPNGYILGQEAGGAFIGGLRYGEGTLYTKNAGDLPVFWQGPSLGWDFGGDDARTMMLAYNLPATAAVYQRFGGVAGSAYFIGGLGMTVLTANNMVLVPIRSASACVQAPMSATLSSRRSGPGTRSESIFAPLQTGEIFAGTLSGGLAAQVEALAVMPCVPRHYPAVITKINARRSACE